MSDERITYAQNYVRYFRDEDAIPVKHGSGKDMYIPIPVFRQAIVNLINATIPTRSQSSASRTLNSAFQISTTRDAMVSYSVEIGTTASLSGGQTGTVFLEIANDAAFTSGVQELARFVNGNSVSLAIAVTVNQNICGVLAGYVPAGKYARLRTANTVGTPSFNYRSGQEAFL